MIQLLQLLVFALVSCILKDVRAVQPIKVQGSVFVNSVSGARFQIIGVAYQPGGSSGFNPGTDPLSNRTVCLRDATLMQRLGVSSCQMFFDLFNEHRKRLTCPQRSILFVSTT